MSGADTATAKASQGAILSVEDLGVAFGGAGPEHEVVRGVSFALPQGETLAIVGESGSGKSISVKSLMGLLPDSATVTRGRARFYDPKREPGAEPVDLLRMSRAQLRKVRGDRIAMIFQEPMSSLSPFHTIGDQVEEALTLHYEERGRAAKARCLEVFGQVGFPDPQRAAESYPFELSGGLRQRAMIAMAMICRPAILIADEPTTALDVSTQALILDLMNQLREEVGLSVLLITHDLGVVANAAQYVTVMSNGRVMEAGRVADILADPRHPYTRRLIEAAPKIEGALAHGERARPTTAGPAPQPKPGRDLIFAAHNVAKTYEARKGGLWSPPQKIYALRGVDLEIPRNRTVALVGESGSGKSTLAKILLRAEIADPGGKLVYDPGDGPQDVSTLDGDALAAFRRQVQIVFQDPYASLSPRMTVQDILMEPLLIHNVGTRAERLTKVKALIQRVGLPVDTLARYPHAFSGGQRQRISIARALALDPKLLLCDEPTSALDVSVQAQVLDLLEELRDQFGLSYLFVSHDLAVVARLADEIAVMCRGAIVEQAPARRLFEAPQHPYTQSLIAAAPEPDPDRRLDLAKIAAGAGAQPEKWPKPFGYEREAPAPICEIAPRHFVRRHDAEPVSKAYSAAAE